MSNIKNKLTTKILATALTILMLIGSILAIFPTTTVSAAAAGPGVYKAAHKVTHNYNNFWGVIRPKF